MCSESARPCHQLNVHWLYIARYTNMSCISSISQPCKVCTEGRRFKHLGIFFGSFSKVFGLSFLGLDHLGLHHVKASKNRYSRAIKWTLNAHFYGFRCTKNMCPDGVKARKNKLFRAMKCLLSIYFYRPWHHHNTIFAKVAFIALSKTQPKPTFAHGALLFRSDLCTVLSTLSWV